MQNPRRSPNQIRSGLPAAVLIACAVGMLPVVAMLWSMIAGPDRGTPLQGLIAGRDFGALWLSGRLGLRGVADPAWVTILFSPQHFSTLLKTHWLFLPGQRLWSYPPPVVLFTTVLAFLPIGIGWVIFAVAGVVAMTLALRAATGIPWRAACLCVLLAPATWDCILAGQDALLFGATIIFGLALCTRRPILAGILLGIATGKPQLGVTTPLALVAGKAWATIAYAALTAAALAALAELIWPGAWHLWLANVVPAQTARMSRAYLPTPSQSYLATAYEFFRAVGIGKGAASWAQLALSGAAMLWVARGFSAGLAEEGRPLAILGAIALLPVAAPYVMDYDLAAVQALALAIVSTRWNHPPACAASRVFLALVPLALIVPGFGFILSLATGLPPIAWLPIGGIGLAALQMVRVPAVAEVPAAV